MKEKDMEALNKRSALALHTEQQQEEDNEEEEDIEEEDKFQTPDEYVF